jgi:ribosomal protein S18 acetylase RimI-like enzyme
VCEKIGVRGAVVARVQVLLLLCSSALHAMFRITMNDCTSVCATESDVDRCLQKARNQLARLAQRSGHIAVDCSMLAPANALAGHVKFYIVDEWERWRDRLQPQARARQRRMCSLRWKTSARLRRRFKLQIAALEVEPAYRRQGRARTLLRMVLRAFGAHMAAQLQVMPLDDATPSTGLLALYSSLGFRRCTESGGPVVRHSVAATTERAGRLRDLYMLRPASQLF